MSDIVQIPRAFQRKRNVEPMPAWGRTDAGDLWLRCRCGLPMGLDHHRVAADGTVSPSLHHDEPQCGWHVFGRLLDWSDQ